MGIFGDGGSSDDYLRLDARLKALEAAVSLLAAEVAGLRGSPAPADAGSVPRTTRWETEARVLKRAGKAIEAIKLVREQTGWDLRRAKDAVDRL